MVEASVHSVIVTLYPQLGSVASVRCPCLASKVSPLCCTDHPQPRVPGLLQSQDQAVPGPQLPAPAAPAPVSRQHLRVVRVLQGGHLLYQETLPPGDRGLVPAGQPRPPAPPAPLPTLAQRWVDKKKLLFVSEISAKIIIVYGLGAAKLLDAGLAGSDWRALAAYLGYNHCKVGAGPVSRVVVRL